jgi:hypothetical protein
MYKLRLAVMGPAIAVMVVLAILAFAQPHLMRPITFALPVVLIISTTTLFVMERARKRKNPSLDTSSTQRD